MNCQLLPALQQPYTCLTPALHLPYTCPANVPVVTRKVAMPVAAQSEKDQERTLPGQHLRMCALNHSHHIRGLFKFKFCVCSLHQRWECKGDEHLGGDGAWQSEETKDLFHSLECCRRAADEIAPVTVNALVWTGMTFWQIESFVEGRLGRPVSHTRAWAGRTAF